MVYKCILLCYNGFAEKKRMQRERIALAKRSFETPAQGLTDIRTGKPVQVPAVPVICRQIRSHRERLGLDQKTLAQLTGVSANAVSNWENGRSRPDVHLLPAICRALRITLDELFALDGQAAGQSLRERRLTERFRRLTEGHRQAVETLTDSLLRAQEAEACPDLRRLLLMDKPLAAGLGDPTEFEEAGEPVYVYASPAASRADYIFRVSGDSMTPDFRDGDLVYVEKTSGGASLQPGELGAFITGNEMYLKRYETDGLHSLNPAYPVMRFTDEDAVYLIGRVLSVMDRMELASGADTEQYLRFHPQER